MKKVLVSNLKCKSRTDFNLDPDINKGEVFNWCWKVCKHQQQFEKGPSIDDVISTFQVFNPSLLTPKMFSALKSQAPRLTQLVHKSQSIFMTSCHFFEIFAFQTKYLCTDSVMFSPKLYIPNTLNIDLILWHTQLIVCAVKC